MSDDDWVEYAEQAEMMGDEIDALRAEVEMRDDLLATVTDDVRKVLPCWDDEEVTNHDRLIMAFNELFKLRAEVERLRAEVVKWQRIRKPTHGNCCTCQRCGEHHEDCRCDVDEVVDENVQLRQRAERLEQALERIRAATEVRAVCKCGRPTGTSGLGAIARAALSEGEGE